MNRHDAQTLLACDGGATTIELVEGMGPISTTKALARLEAAGLVEHADVTRPGPTGPTTTTTRPGWAATDAGEAAMPKAVKRMERYNRWGF